MNSGKCRNYGSSRTKLNSSDQSRQLSKWTNPERAASPPRKSRQSSGISFLSLNQIAPTISTKDKRIFPHKKNEPSISIKKPTVARKCKWLFLKYLRAKSTACTPTAFLLQIILITTRTTTRVWMSTVTLRTGWTTWSSSALRRSRSTLEKSRLSKNWCSTTKWPQTCQASSPVPPTA